MMNILKNEKIFQTMESPVETQVEKIIKNSEFVRTLEGNCHCTIKDPAIEFPFKLDHFQKHAMRCISNDENVLILAHTSSGKTVPAIYAIANYIRKGKKVVYTSPIKALSNQKYKEFREIFEDKFAKEIGRPVSIGLMTGDNKIKPNADCVIMTTEILMNALYDIGKKNEIKKDDFFEDDFIDNIGCVIFDEVHYINDKDRGHVWESVIILLKPSITLVMLSATINKPEEFARWIGENKKKVVNMLPTTHRVVPLEHFLYVDKNIYKIQNKHEHFDDKMYDEAFNENKLYANKKKPSNQFIINELIDFLSLESMLQAIFFSFSKKNCELFANSITTQLVTSDESSQIERIFNSHMHTYEKKYQSISQYNTLKGLIMKGIAFHHSGLLFNLKEIIEIIFQMGLIKVLFATETFAIGVNMPTKTVIFTGLEKPTGTGRRPLHTAEYKQMAGRAGRRGIDTKGNVIILPLYEFPTKSELKSIMLGKMPHIESKFQPTYSFRLKILQSNSMNVDDFMNGSMFQKDCNAQLMIETDKLKSLEEQFKIFQTDETISAFEEYLKFIKIEETYKKNGITLNKKQMKDKTSLIKKIDQTKFEQYNIINKELYQCKQNIDNIQNYIHNENQKIDLVLQDLGYLKNDTLTLKGIISSQINECNCILLTEMITQNIFNDLEPEEICAVLAIFIQESHSDQEISLNKIENMNVQNTLIKVNKIIEDLIDIEKNRDVNTYLTGFYDISYNYVDMVYYWASGSSVPEAFNMNVDMYEGDFIKNILKINNITSDVQSLSKIYGNIEIVPKMEGIQDLLVRDIVTANSLYLS